ncbi:hypothetical protein UFOVP1667_10 [uncultured Caudovirales phage]|uniref:Uncharacterized protein n=1 Tax=uncultured Caudovirales phage TaxID=2100421 RepID=A0A6J5T600_9CAUD|nr:hypothetical protein UFOVP1667_10 [uncultured Caudovirales phage]
MTLWQPEWRILIDTVDYSSSTLANLNITSGRTSIYEQPVAGYGYIELINFDNNNYPFTVGADILISIKDSSSTYVDLYGGFISDLEISVQSSGSIGYVTTARITALGALSKLARANWELALAKAYDGTQIYNILSDLLLNNWNEVAPALTWANYDPTTTWANAENVGLGDIDTPGQYEMIARSADPVSSYTLAAQIAESGLGYLFEDSSGRIGYADALHRQTYLAANGYTTISANQAIGVGLRSVTRSGDVRNFITLNYGNGSTLNVSDVASIAEYGKFAEIFDTNLHDGTQALSVAERRLQLKAYPQAFFDSIEFPLGSPEIDDADRDALLNIFMGLPLQIENLPINIVDSTFQGYVEGWTFRASYNALSVVINASPIEFSQVTLRWNQVSASETWNTLSPTLTWEDAIGSVA